jgi:hypothetical protein
VSSGRQMVKDSGSRSERRGKTVDEKFGNTSGQGRQFSKGLKRDHSIFGEAGGEIWSVKAGDPRFFQKARDQEKTQRTSGRGMPFVSEADSDQQETPQRIYFRSYNCKKNRGIKGRMALPCPETERTGIGQSKVWKIPLRNSGEGLCDLFYRETPDPSDRAESRIKEFSVNHQAASAIGMECSTLPL